MTTIVIATGHQASNERWQATFKQQQPDWEVHSWTPGDTSFSADFAVVWSPPKELFDDHPSIKAVFNIGAGVDGIDFSVIPDSVPVIRVEDGGMSGQMAEYAVYGMLLATQRFSEYADSQKQKQWIRCAPVYRENWPVGVMGFGQVGQKVAKTLQLLGYPVSVWVRSEREQPEGMNLFVGQEQFADFLAQSRVLVNVLPLTPETAGIINQQSLSLLPKGSFVINMARGGHVVDEDLLAALDSQQLLGALLDVFHLEPLPSDHPFWAHPAIHITPHIAGLSLREPTTRQICEKITALNKNIAITGEVKRERMY